MGQHSMCIGLDLLQTLGKRRQAAQFSAGAVTITRTSQPTQTRALEVGGGLRLPRGQNPSCSASGLELTGAPTAPIELPQIIATVCHSPLLVRANGEDGT